MTVSSDINRKTFTGDDASTSFGTSPVVFFDSADLVVYVVDDTTAVATTLTEGTHYSVTGGGTPAALGTVDTSGGSSPHGALLSGTTLVIVRDVEIVQETDFVQNDPSDANIAEATLDRLTMIAQQDATRVGRTLRLMDSDTSTLGELPSAVDRASSVLMFDASGNPIVGDITGVPIAFTPTTEIFNGDGATVDFTLAQAAAQSAVICRIDGVLQTAGVDYTISGSVLTFTTAPATGTGNVVVQVFGFAANVGTVSVDDVTGLSASTGSSKVGYAPSGTGAITRPVQAVLRDLVSDASYSTSGNYDTARAALTARIGVAIIDVASGDNVTSWSSTTAQLVDIRRGTSSSPDTTQYPIVKVSRTMQMASAGIAPSDGSDYAAGVLSVVSGTATNEIQTVSILGYSRSKSTSVATNGAGDACGVYGVGRVTDSGIGIGMGAFFDGRRDTNTGRAAAVQLSCDNNTASAGTYNSIGYSDTLGIWLVPAGTSNSGVGFQIGNPFGVQFDVGIGFNGQVSGGKTGGITTSSIRDDSTSIVSIDIRGTHSGGAIKIADGSGGIAIGGSLTTGRKIDVQGTITGATSIVVINAAGTVASDVTSNVSLVSSTLSTAASSFTLTTVQHHAANQGTVGAGSAITNQYGFIANSSLTGAANNYGFFGNIAAGSGRWNLNMTGTAQNFLSGVTGIGIAASSTAQLALAAGTTGVSSLRVPHGSAPTSPVNGDMWTTTSGLYVQVNGSTVGPLS